MKEFKLTIEKVMKVETRMKKNFINNELIQGHVVNVLDLMVK